MKILTLSAISVLAALPAASTAAKYRAAETEPGVVAFHCEVWNVAEGELLKQLEANVDRTAEQVLQAIQDADHGVTRWARIQSRVRENSPLRFQDHYEVPFQQVNQGQNSDTASFGGTVAAGSKCMARCNTVLEGAIETALQMSLSSFAFDQVKSKTGALPPPRREVEIEVIAQAADGELQIFEFAAPESGTLYLFLRTSKV
jgi:hypothetical protein